MSSSPALPLRVLVTGASTVNWTSWMSGPRSDLTFPRAIEAELLAQGRPAVVRNAAVLGSPNHWLFRGWEEQVLQWSPDVIVSVAGHYETIHLFLPHWFERYANKVDRRPGPVRKLWFRRVIRPIWKFLATVQSKIDGPIVPVRATRRRIDRVGVEYAAYIELCQQVASPAHLVLEILPPAPRQSKWFPGMAGRIAMVNERHRATVERMAQPHIQFFPTSEVVQHLYGDDQAAATPDGFHFTPELHEAIGVALAHRIIAYADTQSHLAARSVDPA